MSVKLMVEVLDHYHGPLHRKLWLIAWAEKANDGSRSGYCKREVLAARLGRSLSRVTHIAGELEAEGTIKRLSAGVWSKAAVYELPPLDSSQGATGQPPAQGATGQQPTSGAPQHPMSATRQQPDSATRQQPIPDNPDKPSSSSPRTPRTGGRGEPAATDDDDDSSQPLTAPDARTLLLGLGADEDELDPIIGLITETTGRDPGEYLREQIGKHGEERVRPIVQRARRKLGLPGPKQR